jgi:hypothetical protein
MRLKRRSRAPGVLAIRKVRLEINGSETFVRHGADKAEIL